MAHGKGFVNGTSTDNVGHSHYNDNMTNVLQPDCIHTVCRMLFLMVEYLFKKVPSESSDIWTQHIK